MKQKGWTVRTDGMFSVMESHKEMVRHEARLKTAKANDPGVPERSAELTPKQRFNNIVSAIKLMPRDGVHRWSSGADSYKLPAPLPVANLHPGYTDVGLVLMVSETSSPSGTRQSISAVWSGKVIPYPELDERSSGFDYSQVCNSSMFTGHNDPYPSSPTPTPEQLAELNRLEWSLIAAEEIVASMSPEEVVAGGISDFFVEHAKVLVSV